jgi:cold-inducible RNA-binding protein
MDKIANRPRGFAFIHYATEEESQKAIEGMHGKVHIRLFTSKI